MDDFRSFSSSFYKISGIDLTLYKEKQMKRRIDTFMNRNGCKNYADFMEALIKNQTLYQTFVNYITINVTEFFRNPEQWVLLKNEIIPMLSVDKKTLRIWSCACSSGEEVYSLLFILKELNIKYELLATDIDSNALNKASEGIYDIRQLKNINSEDIEKYFDKLENNRCAVKKDYKRNVKFTKFNILEENYPKGFDLILCRNLLIYLTEKAKNAILKRLSNALNNEGILFVGSTEQIIFPQNFGLEAYKTFFYRKI